MTSPTADARRTVQGPSRRTVARGAAWTLPVVAIASAAPTASASEDPCKTCPSGEKLTSKGANIPTIHGCGAWYDQTLSHGHGHFKLDFQIGDSCSGDYSAKAHVDGSCGKATSTPLQITWTGFEVSLTDTYGAGTYTATDGLHWLNGEHLDLAFETASKWDSPHHENIVAHATGYFTLKGCSYVVTWTPDSTDHQGTYTASFVKL